MFTKEMLTEQFSQVLISKDEDSGKDIVSLSRSEDSKDNAEQTVRKQTMQKNKNTEKRPMEKKKELQWKRENCAQPVGKVIKFTGTGPKKKWHYKKFEFHGRKYGLEDSVLVMGESADQKPYAAIIKDIYIKGKEGYMKLVVQWFYRPEDVDEEYLGKWESKGARDLFYSFHRDEVFAESVKHNCIVHFVPDNKKVPNRREHPGFIVQNLYDFVKKKLRKFTDNDFNKQQKHEIDILLAQTMSRVGDLPDIEKEHNITMKPRRLSPILEKFGMLTGNLDRDNRLDELLKAVKHKCRVTEKKQAGDYDPFWPDDAVPVVCALEHVLFESFAEDMPKYNNISKELVDTFKSSQVLAERILNGELKPEQNGHTLDEITTVIKESPLKSDDPSTSGPKV
ncbi:unnamed protein product [Microthlaspi erraticum]|uniref:BAH domain-containing protein n=1 Tax=Microthlaspi erraticum TaxID=1685480 RepID=A0A6D2IVH2_9BRAS|nr:unnamed protein product [Microthlaspi erraticum]